MDMHTGTRPGEDWSYAAANQRTTKTERKAWNRLFLTTSEGAGPCVTLTSDFQLPKLQGHPVHVVMVAQETNMASCRKRDF